MTLILALFLVAGSASAADVGEAEHIRLSGDIEQLAGRQLWAGVEKKFAELEKLGIEMSYDDLLHGAQAARALGNAQNAYDRLKVAARIKGTREVVDWLYTIDANYGQVMLIATPPRGITLEVAEVPFDPDQRICVEATAERIKKEGGFSGLLPRGRYTFAGQQFTVEPGIALRIEVSPKMKKTEGELIKVTTTPIEGTPLPGAAPEPTP
ncbi:MAG: hypothetical protein Q8P18_11640 [Pseudomonadota bacterium]|nr:hypothetical protein [Pseudomonadota bacterium]